MLAVEVEAVATEALDNEIGRVEGDLGLGLSGPLADVTDDDTDYFSVVIVKNA